MFNIDSFLGRIRSITGQETILRSLVMDSINNIAPFIVEANQVSIKGGIISIKKLSATAKTELFLKKELILNNINSKQSARKFSDLISR